MNVSAGCALVIDGWGNEKKFQFVLKWNPYFKNFLVSPNNTHLWICVKCGQFCLTWTFGPVNVDNLSQHAWLKKAPQFGNWKKVNARDEIRLLVRLHVRSQRAKVAIAARQRAVEAIVEQNALLIEKNNIFLQKQQARTDVFNGWGINSQHKIPQEIVKSLDPEWSIEDYLYLYKRSFEKFIYLTFIICWMIEEESNTYVVRFSTRIRVYNNE